MTPFIFGLLAGQGFHGQQQPSYPASYPAGAGVHPGGYPQQQVPYNPQQPNYIPVNGGQGVGGQPPVVNNYYTETKSGGSGLQTALLAGVGGLSLYNAFKPADTKTIIINQEGSTQSPAVPQAAGVPAVPASAAPAPVAPAVPSPEISAAMPVAPIAAQPVPLASSASSVPLASDAPNLSPVPIDSTTPIPLAQAPIDSTVESRISAESTTGQTSTTTVETSTTAQTSTAPASAATVPLASFPNNTVGSDVSNAPLKGSAAGVTVNGVTLLAVFVVALSKFI